MCISPKKRTSLHPHRVKLSYGPRRVINRDFAQFRLTDRLVSANAWFRQLSTPRRFPLCAHGYDSNCMALLSPHHDPVDAILAHHGIRGPWQQLPATGIANRIYATDDLVLRIAVEGSEALNDARTESVAAPIARAAGVRVPRLVAFDDSGALMDRPYSLWERVYGETLGLFPGFLRIGHPHRRRV